MEEAIPMEHDRFASILRRLAAVKSRRTALGGGMLALTVTGLSGRKAEIAARKKKHKKKCKKPPALSECAALCGTNCSKCLFRADAGPLCGDGFNTGCLDCDSDDDCAGYNPPVCVSRVEDRASGEITQLCDPGKVCACDPAARGVCVNVSVCGVG
jgi:hypothetical protein